MMQKLFIYSVILFWPLLGFNEVQMEKVQTLAPAGTVVQIDNLPDNTSQHIKGLLAISRQNQLFRADTLLTHGLPHSWEPIGEPLIDNFIYDISVDHETGDIFSATENNGILLSTDGGHIWRDRNVGLDPLATYYAIDINPVNRDIYTSSSAGVYHSSNYADNWEPRSSGLGNTTVADFAFTSSGSVLAGTNGNGIFQFDAVNTLWHQENGGLPVVDYLSVQSIVTNRQTGNVFASTNGYGVYRSSDDGGSWDEVLNPQNNFYVDFLEADSGLVVATGNAGGFSSMDDGATWESWENFPGNYDQITSLDLYRYGGDVNIICGLEGLGVTASYDGGSTWSFQNNGLTAYASYNLSFKPRILYTDNGIYYEDFENGLNPWPNSWLGEDYPPLTTGGVSLGNFWYKEQHSNGSRLPIPESAVFVGTLTSGVFRSTDSLQTWQSVNNGLTNLSITAMAINDSNQIFVATSGGGVFRTEDFGENWNQVSDGLGDLYPSTVYTSADNTTLTGSNFGNISVSHDNGDSWQIINENLPGSPIGAIAINSQGAMFAGTIGYGMYRFSESDSSWEAINSGLPNNLNVLDILVTPTADIYIGTSQGIFVSSDDGNSWSALDIAGLETSYITTLGMDGEGRLYAGTLSQGLYRENTSTQIKQPRQDSTLPHNLVLYPNYPNPFNPVTTIEYVLPKTAKAHLVIYDVTGRLVKTLVNESVSAGQYTIQWDGTNEEGLKVSTGLFFYRLQVGDQVLSKKMIYMK